MAGKPPELVTVVVADDHPLALDALAHLVETEEGLELVASCHDGESTLAAIRDRSPDVAIVDVSMPRGDGLHVAREVQRAGLSPRVLLMSGRNDPQTVGRCIDAGGHGFVSKTEGKEAFLEAIVAVASGERAFPRTVPRRFSQREEAGERPGLLSPQEQRVLQMAADGLSTAEIAAELEISPTTVKTHLRHAAEKLGVRGKTAASAKALRQGLIR